ncbi:MAG: DedA family protein [Chloroflexi bacterium]|nr:DedA family protein [Chloroflexota bacterium]
MSDVATALVAWLVLYTYPVAALTVLVGSLGVPLPSAVVVLAAGSITTTGDDSPEISVLFVLILTAAVAGDMASYSIGRWAGHLVLGRWGGRVGVTEERLHGVERRLERWGGLLVLVTRCLLTGLALPTNLVAGASTFPMMKFFLYALVGETIWVAQLLALGWYFGASWVSLLDYLDDVVTVLTTIALAAGLIWLLVRLLRPSPSSAI